MGVWTIRVDAYERAVVYRDGRVVGVLGPGRHRRPWRASVTRLDVREQLTPVAPQEVLTGDGLVIKVSAMLRWRIGDPISYLSVADPVAVVYLAVQVALRDALAQRTGEEAMRSGRAEVAEALLAAAVGAGDAVGVMVAAVVVKDIMLPADVRAAYAELVTARQRGQAQLEVARAETAALRSLANAAKLLDDHPALARMRLVQAAPYGSKVVLSVGSEPTG